MSYLRAWLGGVVLAGMVVTAPLAMAAADTSPATWLGATEQALSSAPLDLERVRQPQRLATGARGLWRVDSAAWSGLSFRQTFYLAQGRVQRIELVWQPQAAAPLQPEQAFQNVMSTLQATYGPPLMAGGTASWAVAQTDVAMYQQEGALRVVFKVRELRDASTL